MKFRVQDEGGTVETESGDLITDEAMIAAFKENPKPVILFQSNHEAVLGHIAEAKLVAPGEFDLVMDLTKEARKIVGKTGNLWPCGQILEKVGDKVTKFRLAHMSMTPDHE